MSWSLNNVNVNDMYMQHATQWLQLSDCKWLIAKKSGKKSFLIRDSVYECIIIHHGINAIHLFNFRKYTMWLIKKYELTKIKNTNWPKRYEVVKVRRCKSTNWPVSLLWLSRLASKWTAPIVSYIFIWYLHELVIKHLYVSDLKSNFHLSFEKI